MKSKKWQYAKVTIWLLFSFIAALIVAVPNVHALRNTVLGRMVHYLYFPLTTVTITATPMYGAMPITDFQVTETNGDLICTWTNSPVGTATMIRAKYGSAPADISDGYLVYYGPAETTTDAGVYLDENISEIIYVGWADTPSGWSIPVQAIYEGIMSLLTLIIIIIALIGLAFWRQIPILKVISGLVSIAFGAYWSTIILDNYVYVVSGIAIIIVGVFMILTAWSKRA